MKCAIISAILSSLLVTGCTGAPIRSPTTHPAAPPSKAENTRPALVIAAEEGNLQKVKDLLAAGADIKVDGGQALIFSLALKHRDLSRFLIEQGADIRAQDLDHNTPLYFAVEDPYGDEETVRIVELLLQRGADPNAPGIGGETPFQAACADAKIEVVRMLLRHGAKVNFAERTGGDTPLHMLPWRVSSFDLPSVLDVLNTLLEHGADINAVDKEGLTPLDLAEQLPKHIHLDYRKARRLSSLIAELQKNGAKRGRELPQPEKPVAPAK